jgi:hypothetical protein
MRGVLLLADALVCSVLLTSCGGDVLTGPGFTRHYKRGERLGRYGETPGIPPPYESNGGVSL